MKPVSRAVRWIGICLVGLMVSDAGVQAASTYTGASGGIWTNAGNWNKPPYYPGENVAGDNDARINAGSTVNLGAALAVSLANLLINDAAVAPYAQLNVNNGAVLTMAGTTPITVYGNGLVNQTDGTVNGNINLLGTSIVRTGNYAIAGGTLNAPNLRIAGGGLNSAIGQLDLSGSGVVNVSTKLYVAGGTNSKGTFNMAGGTVNLTGTATMDVVAAGSGTTLFHQSGGTFNNSVGGLINLGKSTGSAEFRLSNGTFNANGGELNNAGLLAAQGIFTMSGGALKMGGGNLKVSRENSNGPDGQVFDVTGGTITGVNELWGGLNLQSGATFIVGSNPSAVSTTTIGAFNRGELNLVAGQVVFPVFGNNNASSLFRQGSGGQNPGVLDLSGGTIVIDFDSAYAPLVGHSFDLVNWTTAGVTFSTTNIRAIDYDYKWVVTWDTSQWLSDGILTISDIKLIPEPSTVFLFLSGGWLLWVRRRRMSGRR